jgi:hypothetical protein
LFERRLQLDTGGSLNDLAFGGLRTSSRCRACALLGRLARHFGEPRDHSSGTPSVDFVIIVCTTIHQFLLPNLVLVARLSYLL